MENVYEIIGGKNFPFPSETPIEDQIRWRIIVSLAKYFMANKNGYVYGHVDVYFDDEYIFFDKQDLEYMTDNEKANIKHEVPVSTLDGLKIPLNYIFKWGY